MKGKDFIFIGALAAGAYLLLGGSGAAGGGTEGGGGKKATVLTGSLLGTPTDPATPAAPTQTTFQPSQYLLDLMNGQQNPYQMTPLSPARTQRLWSSNPEVSSVLSTIKKQGATVYTQPQKNDSRMVDYYVQLGGKTGLQPTTAPTVSSKKSSSSGSLVRNTPVKNYAQSGSPGGF